MENGFFSNLSQIFRREELVEISAALVILYVLMVLVVYAVYFFKDVKFIRELKRSIRRSDRNESFGVLLVAAGLDENGNYLGENHPHVTERGEMAEEPLSPYRFISGVKMAYFGFLKRKVPRTKSLLQSLVKTFMTLELERHFIEKVRPTQEYFYRNDPGPQVDVTSFFNTLVRISLAVTFAGIAGILFIAGVEIKCIAQAGTNCITEGSESGKNLSDSVLSIITSSSNKFWITAIGYGLGNVMLILAQLMESYRGVKIASLCKELDIVLDSDEAQSNVRSANDELSTREKSKLQETLTENIESISAMGKEINDELIAKLSNIATHNEEVVDKILLRITSTFADIRDYGIRIPVQNGISDEINALLQILVREVAHSSSNVEKLYKIVAKEKRAKTNAAATRPPMEGASRSNKVQLAGSKKKLSDRD